MSTVELALCRIEGYFKAFIQDNRNRACAKGFAIFAVLSYLYFVANDLNNHDNVSVLLYGYGTGVASGRWFLQILGDLQEKLNGVYNIPLFNAGFGLFYLYLASALIIRILHIDDSKLCFGIGAITASFPTVAASMFFSFTVQFYFLAILLGVGGVYLVRKPKWYRVISSILFALSLGIYQAYFPFVAILLVLSLIQEALDNQVKWDHLLKNSFILLILLVLGYVLYMVLNQVMLYLYGCELNNYRGNASMGKIALGDLPWMIKLVYKYFFLLFRFDYCSVSATPMIRFCVGFGFAITLFCIIYDWKKRPLLKNLELCFLLFILPVAANSIIILVPTGNIYTLMVLGLISVFYLPALMAQNIQLCSQGKKIFTSILCLMLVIASTDYAYQNNGNYRSMYYQNRVTENYYAVLFSQIKSMDGYQDDMEVVFIGDAIDDQSLKDAWEYTYFQYGGKSRTAMEAINAYSRPAFIQYYFGYSTRYATVEEIAKYSSHFTEAETYPNDGSIKIIDHTVFVNCDETSGLYEMLIPD